MRPPSQRAVFPESWRASASIKAGDVPQGICEEPRVLEDPQGGQVQHDADHQHRPSPAPGRLLVHQQPGEEVHQDGANHNEHIDRLSIGVKDQIGQKQEEVSEFEGQKMADQQHHRQKQKQEG